MKLLNFIILRLTLCLTFGILIGVYFPITLHTSLNILIPLIVGLSLTFVYSKQKFKKNIWFGLIAYFTTISIGVTVVNFSNQKHQINHYSHFISEKEDSTILTIRIKEVLKSNLYYDKYKVDLLKVDTENVDGKLLLNITKDSLKHSFNVDDILLTSTALKLVNSPLNPYQFNYKAYLEKQHIYHQIYIGNSSLHLLSTDKHTVFGYADHIRKLINKKLTLYNFKPDELTIINALLLGQRQDISSTIYNSYANAGAIHILAVSGLHVGIILFLLNFVLKPIENIKHGRLIKTIILLVMLWCFAIIAGLSASVTRAVSMFSIVAIAMNLNRPTNIYNTLAISIFFLLLFKPMFLFDVGFQLSYLAVLGIVSIQPILYEIWSPRYKLIDKLWQIFTVSMAAQIGVLPLSLFYFHQFPGLFILSNLLIIPFLGFLLGFGILIILMALLNILPVVLADIFGEIISHLNLSMAWISSQESFIIKDISFGIHYVIALYIFIVTGTQFVKQKKASNLRLVLASGICMQMVFLWTLYHNKTSNEFVIFHKSRYTLMAHKISNKITFHSNLDSALIYKNNIFKNYNIGNFTKDITNLPLQSVYKINKYYLLVIDSMSIYRVKSFKPDYILLTQSPKLNLNRLIDSINPKYIIADGSNYKSYVKRWEETCKKRKLPFHQTTTKGAFIIKF